MGTPSIDPRVALAGLAVGILVGLSGAGGGSLVTPLLVLVMGIKPVVAIGTDLLYSVPTRLLGTAVHHRQRTVNWRLVRYLVLGGVPGALVGLGVVALLQKHLGMTAVDTTLKHALGYILLAVAAAIALNPLLARWRTKPVHELAIVWTRGEIARVIALGATVGVLVSVTSIGSGSLSVPLLYFLLPQLDLRRLVGANVAFTAILTPVAATGYLGMGHVDVGLVASLLVGSLPGVVVGSRLCAHCPEHWLRPALAGVLLFAGSRLI